MTTSVFPIKQNTTKVYLIPISISRNFFSIIWSSAVFQLTDRYCFKNWHGLSCHLQVPKIRKHNAAAAAAAVVVVIVVVEEEEEEEEENALIIAVPLHTIFWFVWQIWQEKRNLYVVKLVLMLRIFRESCADKKIISSTNLLEVLFVFKMRLVCWPWRPNSQDKSSSGSVTVCILSTRVELVFCVSSVR